MKQRRLNLPIDVAERKMIVSLWLRGKSFRAIASESGKSLTTVCRWIRRWKQEGNLSTRPRAATTCSFQRGTCVSEPSMLPQSCMACMDIIHSLRYSCTPQAAAIHSLTPSYVPYIKLNTDFNNLRSNFEFLPIDTMKSLDPWYHSTFSCHWSQTQNSCHEKQLFSKI